MDIEREVVLTADAMGVTLLPLTYGPFGDAQPALVPFEDIGVVGHYILDPRIEFVDIYIDARCIFPRTTGVPMFSRHVLDKLTHLHITNLDEFLADIGMTCTNEVYTSTFFVHHKHQLRNVRSLKIMGDVTPKFLEIFCTLLRTFQLVDDGMPALKHMSIHCMRGGYKCKSTSLPDVSVMSILATSEVTHVSLMLNGTSSSVSTCIMCAHLFDPNNIERCNFKVTIYADDDLGRTRFVYNSANGMNVVCRVTVFMDTGYAGLIDIVRPLLQYVYQMVNRCNLFIDIVRSSHATEEDVCAFRNALGRVQKLKVMDVMSRDDFNVKYNVNK